ncbi:MAG: tetratricopeptide repeat protein [Pseudomonadota bacterium]
MGSSTGSDIASALQQAVALHRQGRLAEAEAGYRALLRRESKSFQALQLLGTACAQQGRHAEAVDLLQQALRLDASEPAVHNNLGNALHSLGRNDEALAAYAQALKLRPAYREAWGGTATVHKALGQWAQALAAYDRAVALQPSFDDHLSRGVVLRRLGREADALAAYDAALGLRPDAPSALYNRANTLLALERYAEALAGFDALLARAPDHADGHNNRANTLLALRRHEDAIAGYDRALALKPQDASAWFNRGNALQALRRYEQALACYDTALGHDPGFAEAHNGRGVALIALQRQDDALQAYDAALAIKPDHVETLHNHGDALMLARRFPAAAEVYERALALDASNKYVLGAAYDCRQHACDWTQRAARHAEIVAAVRAGRPACSPFVFLSVSTDAADQRRCAEIFGRDRHPPAAEPLWRGERYGHAKIRVAYLSADFREHAMAFLMAGLFELHDRNAFEVFGFSFGPRKDDAMRARLVRGFDHFVEVQGHSDREVAGMLRDHEIDIAVDLNGFTLHCRPGIYALRPAPVQVNYLGYPGTLGMPYMDYIVGDPMVIPPGAEAHYAEQVVRVPDCYQVNDGKRPIAEDTPTRAALGLPEQGFVFCCFNNNYKITPEVFGVWMRLLAAVPGSVLWLLADNADAAANLRREAAARGVQPERLVFAPRADLPRHLARHRQADLFLDTAPYNAHTTGSDALWACLPVLTWADGSFASRVAASLLRSVGMPELVARDIADYEARALHLAAHPQELAALRGKLKAQRANAPLFDTDRFRRHLESAFRTMHGRSRQGLPPAAFDVPPLQAPQASPAPQMSPTDAFRNGTALLRKGEFEPALALLDEAARSDPQHAPTHSNRAAALLQLGRFDAAADAARRAVELSPAFPDAWNNLGSALVKLRQNAAALEAYDRALALKPVWADAHNNRGVVLDALRRHGEAAAAYAQARAIEPQYRGIQSAQVFALRKACIWPKPDDSGDAADPIAAMQAEFLAMPRQGRQVAPFVLLAVSDDPALHLEAARLYAKLKYPPAARPLWSGEAYAHAKTRVAYLSADFHSHATAYLMAELFELHDREAFEWWGISFGPPAPNDPMRKRLESAFDHFIDVSDRTDAEAARLLRELEIDIAIDLKGYTQDCRPGILGHRPAPLQVNYLGFPGTMGAEHFQYIVADPVVIPPGQEPFYTEQVVRLPDSYQSNDRKRAIAERTPPRAELGLPEQGFVFCCFNNNYKITPDVFTVWMDLLRQVEGSVLWLLESNGEAAGNLRREAQLRGIAPMRLVFAPHAPLPEHLARLRRADLFLDTLPYNAHTTTSDALWAGVPVLTCIGRAFPGRVAASLLIACGLPDMVMPDAASYAAAALRFARDPQALREVRERLARNRLTHPLFDTALLRRNLEAAYSEMQRRQREGLPPAAFSV